MSSLSPTPNSQTSTFSVLNIRHGSLPRSLSVLPDSLILKFLFLMTSRVLSNPYLLKPLSLLKELLSRERDNPWELNIYEHTCIRSTKYNVRHVTLKSIICQFSSISLRKRSFIFKYDLEIVD